MEQSKKNRKRALAWGALSLALCFMICVFSPLETYLTNITEFWYSLGTIGALTAVTFAGCFVLSWIPFLIFRKTKCFGYLYTFLFFVFIGLYIQGNVVPRPYGIFDGRGIDWGDPSYAGLGIASLAIIAGVIICTVLSIRFLRGRIYKVAPFLCLVVCLAQASTLVYLGIRDESQGALVKESDVTAITDNRVFSLSKEKNIIVLLLDTFDGGIMTDLLNEEGYGEALRQDLSGFTFYPDTVGCYTNTKGAVPYILEGVWYENEEPYGDYVQRAYHENPGTYDALNEAGYSTGVYSCSPLYVNHDEGAYINVMKSRYVVRDWVDFFKNVYKLAAFNFAPHQLKRHFTLSSANFGAMRAIEGQYGVYYDLVEDFWQMWKDKGGFTFTEDAPAFRFYYTEGVHQSYTFDENMNHKEGATLTDEAKGCMTILREMLARIREAGQYDNTAVIVLADHSDGWRTTRGANPLLMVKGFGAAGDFTVSDDAVSFEDLQATYQSLIKGTVLPGSIWSDDIKTRTSRRYMWYQPGLLEDTIMYLPTLRECIVTGPAYDPDSLRITGNIYDPENAYYDPHYYAYTLGTEVNLQSAAAERYYVYGMSHGGSSRDKVSEICFEVGAGVGDLKAVINFTDFFPDVHARVFCEVNGQDLGEIHSGEPFRVDGGLIGDDGMLRLRFTYPDATTGAARGESGLTYLYSVRYGKLCISKAEN